MEKVMERNYALEHRMDQMRWDQVRENVREMEGRWAEQASCKSCFGSGRTAGRRRCSACNGTGSAAA